jgi:hypothetical protein
VVIKAFYSPQTPTARNNAERQATLLLALFAQLFAQLDVQLAAEFEFWKTQREDHIKPRTTAAHNQHYLPTK